MEKSVLNAMCALSVEVDILKDAKSRQRCTLEANHNEIDIDDCAATISTLTSEQQQMLATKLRSYPHPFSGA